MAEHVIVWDLETVPDLDAVARAHHLPELDVEVAREALGEKFPKLPFHQIVCIGAVVAEKVDGVWWITAIGAPHIGERSEKELIAAFVEKIAALNPRLVTFNGTSFDLPVLRYRAMLHRISAPALEKRLLGAPSLVQQRPGQPRAGSPMNGGPITRLTQTHGTRSAEKG